MKPFRIHITLLFFMMFGSLPLLSSAQLSPSQYNYPHNHLPWYSIETQHFNIFFQEGNSQSAEITAHITEAIYPGITSLYHYEPDTKTNIVLKDRADYSNGATYFFDNQIDIWVPTLNTPLRGTHDWFWDVITHEFTHIVQLQAAMKRKRTIPAIYLQWLSYSDVRRPDVLYGYPKGILSYPLASLNVPAWLAEGVAQYQRSNYEYDYWDSHRDMLLRTAILSDDPLGFEEMGSFASKNSLQREQIYNQGFAFTTFLTKKYGEQILPAITEELGKHGVFTVDKAIANATSTSGKRLFDEFIRESKAEYNKAMNNLELTKTHLVEQLGFLNFYPKVSKNGNALAYLSNKDSKAGNIQLFIHRKNNASMAVQSVDLGHLIPSYAAGQNQAYQDTGIKNIRSDYAFSPNGKKITFSRQKLNKYGEQYNDLFVYDINTHAEKRLTHSQRLTSPVWHPSEPVLAAVKQTGNSTNLIRLNLKTGQTKQLTYFQKGQQVYTPTWNTSGDAIYFAYSDLDKRDIYKLDYQSSDVEPILQDSSISYRDPFIDSAGAFLYYSADPDGIFNIYRVPLGNAHLHPQKLTSVPGGAFMPAVNSDTLYFAEYKDGGYKISSINLPVSRQTDVSGNYNRSPLSNFKLANTGKKRGYRFNINPLKPTELDSLSPDDSLQLNLSMPDHQSKPVLHPYKNTYTDFSFYPVIRFDNYSQKFGRNGHLLTAGRIGDLGKNLLRDMKLGTYFSSRDVTGKLSIYGGAMFGLASEPSSGIGNFFSPARLTNLDRDLFLSTEYRGLPFITERWSPTISIELTNLRRNVSNGLSIEEFPCTSCLPDTTHADIAYNIWEANLYLRSKINENNLVELGIGYSPYRVQTNGFYSKELQQFIPASSSEYFKGTTMTAAYVYEDYIPYPDADVAPVGLRASLRYKYEPNELLDDYEIKDGILSPVFKTSRNHSVEATLQYGYATGPHSSVDLYTRGFSYLNAPDDYFYLDYIGGFTGMRSYPYFAIGGNTTAMLQLSYTFPILRNLNRQIGRYTLDKLFLRIFTETGNGWGGPLKIGNHLKTGLGTELRFAFNSYYLFPLKLFVSGSYGFNKFDVTLPDAFITGSSNGHITYGREFLVHFGLTFDFNILHHD